MIGHTNITVLIGVSICIGAYSVSAADYPLPKEFPNYYFNEPQGPTWVMDAKVTLQSPSAGTPLPTSAIIGLQFTWNSAGADEQLNRERVFKTYSSGGSSGRGTQFDLCTAPESTGVYAYTQQSTILPTLSNSSPAVATVRFAPITIAAPANGTVTTLFEIYGDCDQCAKNKEARPPDRGHTTWRIFGKLRVTADGSGNLASAEIIDQDSESPQKKLDDTGHTIYPPEWFPIRKLDRRQSFATTLSATCACINGTNQPNTYCSRRLPLRRFLTRCHRCR
jgi:hypothetical protein